MGSSQAAPGIVQEHGVILQLWLRGQHILCNCKLLGHNQGLHDQRGRTYVTGMQPDCTSPT